MKKHLKKLRPLLLLAVLFMLTNCQEEYDDHSQENSQHASDMKIVTKSFKDFEELPGLIDQTISRLMLRKAKDIYDFKIDSTQVMEITTPHGKFYTMLIKRDSGYDIDMFENLVICDRSAGKEAYIISYAPDADYYNRLKTTFHAPFIGGMYTTRIDYSSLKKSVVTTCVETTIAYCGNGTEGQLAGPGCYENKDKGKHIFTKTFIRCTTWLLPVFADYPFFNNRVNINPGGGGGGSSSGGSGYDPGYNPGEIPGVSGGAPSGNSPISPGRFGPVTGPIGANKSPHEKNCKELADMMDRTGIRASFNDLNTKTGESKENGYKFEDGKTPKPLKLQAGTINHMELESGGQIYGGSHTHPDPSQSDYMPMFSLADVVKLGYIAYNYKPLPGQIKNIFKCVLTLTVKTAGGNETYALKIEDWYQFGSYILQYNVLSRQERIRKDNRLKDEYLATKENGGGMENYLKDLFKFMKKQNINGIAIYKANTDFSEWNKQEYNPETNTITPKPCN